MASCRSQTRPSFVRSQAKSHDDEVRRDAKKEELVSVFNAKGPPVPIPNTEVKLCSAENTCLETDREDRSTLTQKSIREGKREFAKQTCHSL